jgi:diaminohydroxyphosphoribosylaminopyrimidine deaminase/5-amino-6-(5-phosphoribosylamino)uracil reductase
MVNPQQVATRNPHHVLSQMFEDGVRHVMIEGGATLASSFISAGLVDQLLWFTAPKILGSGTSAIANLGISNINEAIEWHLREVKHIGSDVMLDLRPQRVSS